MPQETLSFLLQVGNQVPDKVAVSAWDFLRGTDVPVMVPSWLAMATFLPLRASEKTQLSLSTGPLLVSWLLLLPAA